MKERVVLDRSMTPDGEPFELAIERGHHIITVSGVPLMSSEMRGSEEAMATVAKKKITRKKGCSVLIGGLGMGFTLRATLDAFDESSQVCVAELMDHTIRYNREFLGDLAGQPLADPRVTLYHGDVRDKLLEKKWDVILMDVDNGPDAFSVRSNHGFYTKKGTETMSDAVAKGGVLVVWSAYPSPRFMERMRATGLTTEEQRIRGRWPLKKGPMHTLFVSTRPY